LQPVKKYFAYILLATIVISFGACKTVPYRKVVKSTDLDFKYTQAKTYFDKGQYVKAKPLFEELITLFKGTKSIDEIYFMYAQCHFHEQEFLSASFHFKNIHDSYPLSQFAEECLYRYAECYFYLSPNPNLDQTFTEKGLEAMQLYINSYPETTRINEANNIIDLLRRKLEIKEYTTALLYLKTRHYKASAVSFQSLLNNYPDTEDAEEAEFNIIKAYFLYAENSYKRLQVDRYKLAIKAFQSFEKKHKESKFYKTAREYYDTSQKRIEDILSQN